MRTTRLGAFSGVSACLCTLIAATVLAQAQTPAVRVIKVAGNSQKLALMSDGRVFGWGQYRKGQLGPIDGLAMTRFGVSRPALQTVTGKVIDVAANENTSYALLDDGTVWAWGDGSSGQLGSGPNPNLPLLKTSGGGSEYRGAEQPVRVRVGSAIAIAASGNTGFAVLRDGTVQAWGLRNDGLLADGVTGSTPDAFAPVTVRGTRDVASISTSGSHVLALTKTGRVLAWGWNLGGALGQDPATTPELAQAVEVPGLTDVIAISTGLNVSTALKKDGTVWVWGSNRNGLFGDGVQTGTDARGTRFTPALVPGVINVAAITTGISGRHTMALLKDGTLRGWGNSDFGQIGAGVSGNFQPKPVTPRITGVSAVFAAGNNTFALKTDGTFWGWGGGNTDEWPLTGTTRAPVQLKLP
jgi:alpha-tubulin suppressor-like RCC1 family protein